MNNTDLTVENEKRCIGSECRTMEQDGKRFIEGYAIVYEQKSKLISEWGNTFQETIKRGAVDKFLNGNDIDVIATPNHDYDKVIGRTVSGTLMLVSDDKGLRYVIEVPNTTAGNDVYESIKRGDIFESSFTFRVEKTGQRWYTDSTGIDQREITEIDKIMEVAPVTWGAYSNTRVNARGYKEYKDSQDVDAPALESNIELFNKKLTLIKLHKK
jgi:uncharacterized protein